MKTMLRLLFPFIFGISSVAADPAAGKPAIPVPTQTQLSWQNAEVVALFHMDPRIYQSDKPRVGNIHNVHLGKDAAREYASAFNPVKLDTDQWIETAKEMGATAAVLVAKHEAGFCFWQSDANPYCLKMLKWRDGKGDIMRDFVDSCRKHRIKPGVVTTTRFDNRLGVTNSVPMKTAKITREEYNRLQEAEVTELCSRYGDLFALWLDGGAPTPAQGGPDLLPIFEKQQPKTAIFYHTDDRRDLRWGGNEDGVVGDPCWSTVEEPNRMNWGTGSPDGAFWCPAMADAPIVRDWFWRRDGNRGLRPLDNLKAMYLNSVGRNATLVLGLTPDTDGLVPETDVTRCRELGAWIKTTFGGEPLAKTSGEGNSLTLELPAGATSELNVVLQEEIAQGERVREYRLQQEENGTWMEVKKGSNIGHKRIVQLKPGTAAKLRLSVTNSSAEPIISNFSVYAVHAGKPVATPAVSLGSSIFLKNDRVLRELEFDGHVWRTVRFSRADGTGQLQVRSDEFHILFPNDEFLTLDHYEAGGAPEISTGNVQKISITYQPRRGLTLPDQAPRRITIEYTLAKEPYLRKNITLHMREGQAIDRLEVERFTTGPKQSRGGRGEPVYVNGEWFFGAEFPACYTRHTDGNTPEPYSNKFDKVGNYSFISLDGRDVDPSAGKGMIRIFHFPGTTRTLGEQGVKQEGWGIVSKTSVCGVGIKDDPMELVMMDYLSTIRRPVRGFVHYNNWYDGKGKNLRVENFADNVAADFVEHLAPYGVKLHAMVPDEGWQSRKSIWEPHPSVLPPHGWDGLQNLSNALQDKGTSLGLWMSLNGYVQDVKQWGRDNGYARAVPNSKFERYKPYYSLAQPKYRNELRKNLRRLIETGGLSYIKHDFNNMCDMGPDNGSLPTDRHGHERAVEITIEMLALEREVNPSIYQNLTNWSWFSPWWLMHCNSLWMLAGGDEGANNNWPQISRLQMRSTHRCSFLWDSWADPQCRPLVPISHLMVHGIVYTNEFDTLRDWSDYVVMYYGRGLQLKEWYITPSALTDDRWRVLAQATRWSEENMGVLANAVIFGSARPDSGEPYGYACWSGDKGVVTVRNPDDRPRTLAIPFDKTVWYRGKPGRTFRAEVIYPYQEQRSEAFVSGRATEIEIPADTVMVMELCPGAAVEGDAPRSPVPPLFTLTQGNDKTPHRIVLEVPADATGMCNLRVTKPGGPLLINGEVAAPVRSTAGPKWGPMREYDLKQWLGKKVELTIAGNNPRVNLVMDRQVTMTAPVDDKAKPWPLGHGLFRSVVSVDTPTADGRATGGQTTSDQATRDWNIPVRKENFHIFLLMGQSNMSGYGHILPEDKEPVPHVLKLPTKGALKWEPAAHPLHNRLPSDRFGLGIPFAKEYLKNHPGVTVGFIPLAWGGVGIDALKKGTAVYEDATTKAAFAATQGVIKGVLWHQGESDTVNQSLTDSYERKLHQLIADVRGDLKNDRLPFIVGNLAEFYGTSSEHNLPDRVLRINKLREILRNLPSKVENTGFVESTGCASIDGHNVHFDRASYIILGERYAMVYEGVVKLPGKK